MSSANKTIGKGRIEILRGDITTLRVDAIVNAANVHLQHGGGVAAAIVRKGGQIIQQESDAIIARLGRSLETGEAVITSGGQLPAKYVIHVAGPIWGDGNEDAKLERACSSCLALADEKKLTSVAFPAISTGVYRFPVDRAARILVQTTARHLEGATGIERAIFCLFDDKTREIFVGALNEL